MANLRETVTLQSRFSRALAVLVIAICALTEVSLIVYGDLNALARGTSPLALVGFGAYVLFWAPLVRLTPATVEIVNPIRTHVVTWPAIEDVETRWGLKLVTAAGTISAWASPAQSRYGSMSRIRRDSYGRADFAAEKRQTNRADNPTSVAGIAPMLILQQWEEYRDAGLLGVVEGTGVSVTWHRIRAIVLGILVLLTIAGIAVPQP